MKTPASSMALVLTASLIGSVASVFLKAGANRLHRDAQSLKASAPWLAAGVAMFLGSFVFYTAGVRNGSLTVLYPMVSLGYVWTLLWSRVFFGEPFNKHKVYGVALVLCGVVSIAVGNQ